MPTSLTVACLTAAYQASEREFEGLVSYRIGEEVARFEAKGVMGASASFSFVVVNPDDEQGLDLAVPLVGDLRSVCGTMPPLPVKK